MAKRKALSKKLRFEVFKRDSFKCQYCGRSAPEVILHVDHIKPIKAGGDNDIFNLVTACSDCNSGKGARRLSDKTEIEKQKEELDALNERREQIEMMMQWRESLKAIHETEIDALSDAFSDETGYYFTEQGRISLAKLVKKFSFLEVLTAIESASCFDPKKGDSIKYLSVICSSNRASKEKPWITELYYIRGILRNRIRDYDRNSWKIMSFLEDYYNLGIPVDTMKSYASRVDRWSDFVELMKGDVI